MHESENNYCYYLALINCSSSPPVLSVQFSKSLSFPSCPGLDIWERAALGAPWDAGLWSSPQRALGKETRRPAHPPHPSGQAASQKPGVTAVTPAPGRKLQASTSLQKKNCAGAGRAFHVENFGSCIHIICISY